MELALRGHVLWKQALARELEWISAIYFKCGCEANGFLASFLYRTQ